MPRVVIELQANTQDAVQKIQQFARAQKDAFDAVRAGNPALADSAIKVSTLQTAYQGATKAMQDFARQGPPTAASIKTITNAVTDARGAVVAYGTASAAQKAASAQFFETLTSGAEKSGTALGGMDKAAKDLAKGGVREMLTNIPVVGGALAKLVEHMGAFPLAVGAAIGAGVGFITMLKSMAEEAEKTLNKVGALSLKVGTDFQKAVAEIDKIRAGALNRPAAALEFGARGERGEAKAERDRAIKEAEDAAKLAEPKIFSKERIADVIAGQGFADILGAQSATASKRLAIAAELAAKLAAAEQKYATDVRKIDEQLLADQIKLSEARLDSARDLFSKLHDAEAAVAAGRFTAAGQDTQAQEAMVKRQKELSDEATQKRIEDIEKQGLSAQETEIQITAARRLGELERQKIDQEAAAKRKEMQEKLVEDATRSGLEIAKTVGAGFEEATKKLSLEQFTAKANEEIEKLNRLIAMGADKNGAYAITVKAIEDALKEAASKGMVPATEETKKLNTALAETKTVADAANDSIAGMFKDSIAFAPQTIEVLDQLIAKGKEVVAAMAAAGRSGVPPVGFPGAVAGAVAGGGSTAVTSATGGGPLGPTGVFGLGFTTLGGIAGQSVGSGLTPFGGQTATGTSTMAVDAVNTGVTASSANITISGQASFGGDLPGGNVTNLAPTFQFGGRSGAGMDVAPPVAPAVFQSGGIVPGHGPMPIIAHGGEAVLPERLTQALAGGLQPSVHIHPGAIQIAGTFIDQQRAWGSMVEELGQALEARAMRR
jgi:hypothetical protein